MATAIVLDLGYLTLQEFRELEGYQMSIATIAALLELSPRQLYGINAGEYSLTTRHQRELWLLWREIERMEEAAY